MKVHLDAELCGVLSLPRVGTDVWTRDPATRILMLSYAINLEKPRTVFFDPVSSAADELLDAVEDGAEIHAWNAAFEFCVWNNILAVRYAFPKLPIHRFHCTMATAACAGLPMDLDTASQVAATGHLKDRAGHALMLRMSRPRGYDSKGRPVWWHETDPARFDQLADYNVSDVQAERAISNSIPPMSASERWIWLADQRMNQRGLPVDLDLLDRLQAITDTEINRLNKELAADTNGHITNVTQNARLLAWAQSNGCSLQSLERPALENYLVTQGSSLRPEVEHALYTRLEAAKTSTAKLKALRAYRHDDGCCRYLVQYGGAVRTLRWAGRGPQIQNFPRPVIEDVSGAIRAIKKGIEPETLRFGWGKPLDVVSSCLRGVFRAPPGYKFLIADFTGIEARVLAWLARHAELLAVFKRGEDVYIHTAAKIGSRNRQLGKVLVLACGYGMGWRRFQETARTYGLELSDTEAQQAVYSWRAANYPINNLWRAYETCVRCVLTQGTVTAQPRRIFFQMGMGKRKDCLLISLPSGRDLVYRNARIEQDVIAYDGVNQYTHKWGKIDTYGGKLVENVTQAVARDLLADALTSFEAKFYGCAVTTVHDEIVCLVPDTKIREGRLLLERAMSGGQAWAKDLPLTAKVYVSERYGKEEAQASHVPA